MLRFSCIVAFGVFACIPALGVCATAENSVNHHPPDWLHVSVQQVPDGFAATTYQEMWTKRFVPHGMQQSSEAVKIEKSDDVQFLEALSKFELSMADYSWHFQNPQGLRWPTRAIRIYLSDSSTYKVNVVAYCESSDHACAQWVESLHSMKAPQPRSYTDKTHLLQWQEVVLHEPCTPGPIRMPDPQLPPDAPSNNSSGRVIMRLLTNPCGEVRGYQVERSSRLRHLDRAATDTVLLWRIDLSPEQKRKGIGAIVSVPLDFALPAKK